MPPKTKEKGFTPLVNRLKRKRKISRRLIESVSEGSEQCSPPAADDNVPCAPLDQSRVLDVDQSLPQIQAPATDGRLVGK